VTAASEPGNGEFAGSENPSRHYVESGLAVLGLAAGADEIAVIEAVDAVYGPALEALLADGFDHIPHEPGADMSKPPRNHEER
jgi:hypothetical protein